MLDKYKDGQPVAYQMMTNAIINNKISHAYLFDSNGNPDAFDIVLSFVKEIVLLDCDDSSRTNVIKRIDETNDNSNYVCKLSLKEIMFQNHFQIYI